MFGLRRQSTPAPATGPVLDLSGDKLRRAFADLAEAARPSGGIERYVTALDLKAALFDEILGLAGGRAMTETEFLDLCAFITPVRRRIASALDVAGLEAFATRITALLDEGTTVDARTNAFAAAFPQDKAHRWVRDLAAEVLHFTRPTTHPLRARWIWDARVGTGVLREIWHAEDPDAARIEVGDAAATFDTLRAELDGFLAGEGVFRDRHWYADLLMAHVYAGYINDRGGQYLRSDFTWAGDPMAHTRRMLGLDAVDTETGRTRLRLIDGRAHEFGGSATARLDLSAEETRLAHP